MRYRDLLALNGIGGYARCITKPQVCGDLMAEKIEINPGSAAAPLGAAKDAQVECPGYSQIIDWKGQVENSARC